MSTANRVEAIASALLKYNPSWQPLSEEAKAAIAASADSMAPLTEQQCADVARLMRGSPKWKEWMSIVD